MLVEYMDPFELWATCQLGASFRFLCPRCGKIHVVLQGRLSDAAMKCELSRRSALLNKSGQIRLYTGQKQPCFKLPDINAIPMYLLTYGELYSFLRTCELYAPSVVKLYRKLNNAERNYNLYTQGFKIPLALLCGGTDTLRSFVFQVGIVQNLEYQQYLKDCRELIIQFHNMFLDHPEPFNPFQPHKDIEHSIITTARYSYFGFPAPIPPLLTVSVELEKDYDAELQPDLSDPITKYIFDFLNSVYREIDIYAILGRYNQVTLQGRRGINGS